MVILHSVDDSGKIGRGLGVWGGGGGCVVLVGVGLGVREGRGVGGSVAGGVNEPGAVVGVVGTDSTACDCLMNLCNAL
jgi:hypothetical protein